MEQTFYTENKAYSKDGQEYDENSNALTFKKRVERIFQKCRICQFKQEQIKDLKGNEKMEKRNTVHCSS